LPGTWTGFGPRPPHAIAAYRCNKPDPANIHVEQCQRTGPTLTVLVYPSGELTSAQVAAATDDIWRSVSG